MNIPRWNFDPSKYRYVIPTIAVFALLFLLQGCGDSITQIEAEKSTYTITTYSAESGGHLHDVKVYKDDTGQQIGENTDSGNVKIEREIGTQLRIRIEHPEHAPGIEILKFTGQDQHLEALLYDLPPDEVLITYKIIDSDNTDIIEEAQLFLDDELASKDASGQISVEYGLYTIDFCGQAEGYETNCREVIPDHDQEITIRLKQLSQ